MEILSSDVKHIIIKMEPTPSRPFLSGESVAGTVTLITEKEGAKVAKLVLKISGKVHVEWTEQVGAGEEAHTVTREQKWKNFKFKIPLEDGEKVLPMGGTQYNFNFTIPDDARSSFVGQHGSVKYKATVKADIPWGKDAKESLEFFVNGINDLNKQHKTLETYESQKTKTFGFLCCQSGPLTVKMKLEKTGFVCGECIGIIAEVNNKSDKRIGAVKVSIYQTVHYKADGDHKFTISEVVKKFSIGAVEPGAEELLEHQLKVPPLPPTYVDPHAIAMSYVLKLEADPDGAGFDLDMPDVPLVIANVPHQKTFPYFENDDAIVELSEKLKTEYADIPKVLLSDTYLVYSFKNI